jgi:hypothetical protein
VTEPRLMSGIDAAAYLGLTPATFAQWVADGRAPKALPGTRRWDRRAIDLALDKASGIAPSIVPADDPFAAWEAGYETRKAAAGGGNRQ